MLDSQFCDPLLAINWDPSTGYHSRFGDTPTGHYCEEDLWLEYISVVPRSSAQLGRVFYDHGDHPERIHGSHLDVKCEHGALGSGSIVYTRHYVFARATQFTFDLPRFNLLNGQIFEHKLQLTTEAVGSILLSGCRVTFLVESSLLARAGWSRRASGGTLHHFQKGSALRLLSTLLSTHMARIRDWTLATMGGYTAGTKVRHTNS